MKTKDLKERLEICQDLTSILHTADVRIKSYNEYLEGKNISPREYASTRKQIESAERAKDRIRQRLSKLLMGMYADLTPMDEIYTECNDKVKSIEYQGYFDQMFVETTEGLKELGL
jgi:putative component of toxin-antitoxin plasmid stabilization module